MLSLAAGRLVGGMTVAADVLRSLLADADPHVRHNAAVKIIELCVKVTELSELEVEELSVRINGHGGPLPRALPDDVPRFRP